MRITIDLKTFLLAIPLMLIGFLIIGFSAGWLPAVGVLFMVFGSGIKAK